MKRLITFALIYSLISLSICNAQNVSINTNGVSGDPSAGLDIGFSNKGLLIPRVSLVSLTDTVTIPTPANALLVYNINPNTQNGKGIGYYFYCSTGCITRGWKFMPFSDSSFSAGSEWTFYSKKTIVNSSANQNFTSLPLHDKWKLVFDIQGSSPSYTANVSIRLNGVSFFYYGTKYASGAPQYADRWYIYKGSSSLDAFSGEIIITGKYFTNQNSKIFTASIAGNQLYNSAEALSGFLINNPQNVNSINIMTEQEPVTGVIELWFKDNH